MYYVFSNKFVNFIRCATFKNILQIYSKPESVVLQQFRCFKNFTPINNISIDMASSNASILERYIQLTSQFTLKNLSNFSIQMIDASKEENRVSLLQCCGKLLSNKSLAYRRDLSNFIFQQFENLNFLGVEEYNMYINICTENEVAIDSDKFLRMMECAPNEMTYKLLLQNVCEVGDVDQAHDILSAMKKWNYVVNEKVFNAIILANTILSGYDAALSVLNTMKTAQITPSSDTNWNIILGLITRGDMEEFKHVLKTAVFDMNEEYFIRIVTKLGLVDCEDLIEMLKVKFNLDDVSRHLLTLIEHLCIQLIHRNKASMAIKIYCMFTKDIIDETQYNFLLVELLEAEIDSSEIVEISDYLKKNGKHEHVLEFITNTVFTKRDADESWYYLKHFEKLKPLYFWPILLKAGRENGEIGILDTLSKMRELNVEIDSETLEKFALCYCEISPPHRFLARMQHLNIPMRQLLTPLLVLLLKNNNIKDVYNLCQEFKPQVEGEKLTRPLAISWTSTDNSPKIVGIMKRIYENNNNSTTDFVGETLVYCLKFCKEDESYSKFLELLKMLQNEKLTITTSSDENIQTVLDSRDNCPIKDEIENALDNLLDLSMNNNNLYITHPRYMNVEQLECHLIELTNKNMETRGVLRRLLQAHSRAGNYVRVEQIRKLIEQAGYKESPGMLALRLQNRIKSNDFASALNLFDKLKENYPDFRIDEYKIINLAALLINENRFETAMEVLKKEFDNRNIRGGLLIERNCITLLHAAKNPGQAMRLYTYLTEKKLCEPKNTIFGPILLSYLKCNDLENGVKYYEDICKAYNCTPMQVELLKVTAENEDLFRRVVNATIAVYGIMKTQMSMVVAFAEKGKKEDLLKLLLDIRTVPNSELQNRCSRWVNSGSLEPLLTFIETAVRLPRNKLNLNIPYMAIVRLFDNKNDVDGLLQFTNKLKENDIILPRKITEIVNAILKRNKRI